MAVQKKKSGIPPSQGPLSNRTYENKGAKGLEGKAANIKPNTQTKKTACSSANKSAKISNTATPRNTAGANGLNVDERLRLVRERREEQEKFLASRGLSWLEREQRARQYHEKQLEERKKKLLEQRMKEERRRAAVEEKRKQRLKEEKERYESAVRRTLEKSRRAQKNHNQNCRGRLLSKNNVPRRLPLTTWEKNLVSRLLTPTCSYLARSKSAGCHSGEEVSCHSMNNTTMNNPITTMATLITTGNQKPGHHFSPAQQRASASPSQSNRSINPAQIKPGSPQEPKKKKMLTSKPPTAISTVKPITKPQSRTASASPERTRRRSSSRMSTPLQLELPSVPEEETVCSSALSPSNMRPIRTQAESLKEETGDVSPPETPCSNSPAAPTQAVTSTKEERCSLQMPPPSAPLPPLPEPMSRPLAGTTDPEEASRVLAQKRREARLRKEREEQNRLQEEADRRHKEELEVKRVEEKARLQAEAQRLVEEKRKREEEEQRKAEEERALAMKEAALLLKQREEEQEREKEKAAQMKREREIIANKEEEARQARKKRLEEIMRRTRRTEPADTKSMPERILPNEVQPKENTEPVRNGTIAEAAKPPQQVLNEDMVPVVAFKERRSLRTLTSLEEMQTHQRAEVI